MDQLTAAFASIEKRAFALRLTIPELLERAGVTRVSYWRAKNNRLKTADGPVPTIRALEGKLDELERERAA